MLRRVDRFPPGSKLDLVYGLRAKFNDSLNNAVAKINQHMLTITSCNTSSHFDQWDKLSQKGKIALWYELDELLEKFDEGQIKLLPTPQLKNKPGASLEPQDWHHHGLQLPTSQPTNFQGTVEPNNDSPLSSLISPEDY